MSMVRNVAGGIDTHADAHVCAAIDSNGGILGVESFPADHGEFEALLGWPVAFGEVTLVGVEGTRSGCGADPIIRLTHPQMPS